jgi:hypothetical protein
MTYIKVQFAHKVFKKYNNDPEYILDLETKVFRSRAKFYEFCQTFFSDHKKISYTSHSSPKRWYQEWLSSPPYPYPHEIRSVYILKNDIDLNPVYVDTYSMNVRRMLL